MAAGIADWARRLGQGAVALGLASGLTIASAGPGHRFGTFGLGTSLAVMQWGTFGALGALLVSLIALGLALWRGDRRAWRTGALAIALAAVVLAGPLMLLYRGLTVPPIHDITTDLADPPAFDAILSLRADAPNPATHPGLAVADQQRRAYPDIGPLVVEPAPGTAYATALETVGALGWTIVGDDPGAGRIEATTTTFWFGFADDIVIRVRPEDDGSRVDIRSVSRLGVSDLGKNAERIRHFFEAYRERLAAIGS